MRVTVFGASGLLGQALVSKLSREQLSVPSSKNVDLRDVSTVRRVVQAVRPEWIILAAAYTDVDGCESNRELAFAVNRDGAVNVARAAKDVGSRLIFLSSDYVFDGVKNRPYEAEDERNPISVYGQSKAQAEERLLEIMQDVVIVRTSWLFGIGGKCFPETILKLASSRPELSVVNDQRGSPTLTDDLAAALVELFRKNARGIVHVTNSGDCTWYEFATEIVNASGLNTEIKPVSTADFPRPARRPAYSVLSPTTRIALGIKMPSWQDALRRYLTASSLNASPRP